MLPALDLVVDLYDHADEIARFHAKVVRGPDRHCWFWTGAIADDGYGRFWLQRPGEPVRVVRPHRYAVALSMPGEPLAGGAVTLHDCDEPLCVRAEPEGGHVLIGTQAENLATMGRRGRGGGYRSSLPDRAERAARSRAIRDALANGWDPGAVQEAVANLRAQPTLFPWSSEPAT